MCKKKNLYSLGSWKASEIVDACVCGERGLGKRECVEELGEEGPCVSVLFVFVSILFVCVSVLFVRVSVLFVCVSVLFSTCTSVLCGTCLAEICVYLIDTDVSMYRHISHLYVSIRRYVSI